MKNKLMWGLVIILFGVSIYITGFDMEILASRYDYAIEFIKRMIPPDTKYLDRIIMPLIITVQMSVAGTFFGAFLGLITAFFYANNITKNPIIRGIVHILVQSVRTMPVLIIALVCTFVWGIGALAGTIALTISTWAVLSRIGGEDLSETSLKTYEAIRNSGAGRVVAFVRTVLVSFLPGYLSNTLYIMEANIRHAAILGYVGAGGIGLLLNEKIAWREYERVGMILVLLYLLVLVIEVISSLLNNYLKGKYKRTKAKTLTIITMLVIIITYSVSGISWTNTSRLGMRVARAIAVGILKPDLNYMFMWGKTGVLYLCLETVCIAIAGTLIGAFVALFFALISSSKFMPIFIAVPVKMLVMAIRTVPVYVYGLIFIRVCGPGSFAGVLTMIMCSIGLLAKRFTVAFDNCDLSAWRAYKNMGASWLPRIKYCILWPLKPQLIKTVFYRFDVNIRSASILGLVGAGGIGAPLIIYMNNYKWDAVGAILIPLFVIVLLTELIEKYAVKHFS